MTDEQIKIALTLCREMYQENPEQLLVDNNFVIMPKRLFCNLTSRSKEESDVAEDYLLAS